MSGFLVFGIIAMLAILVYDLWTGRVFLFQCIDNFWVDLIDVEIGRLEEPLLYWTVILIEIGLILGVFLKFFK